jgi:hypothetical protein
MPPVDSIKMLWLGAVLVAIGEFNVVVTSSHCVSAGHPAGVAKAGLAYKATATTGSINRCFFKTNLVFAVGGVCPTGRGPILPAY